jgi:ferredoxin, 2Fe-2S
MPTVTYIEHGGRRHEVHLSEGETVMQGAVNNMIEGIVAECGGGLACATCHCYVDEGWYERTGEPSAAENDMLDAVSCERGPTSRWSCQITMTEDLSGLVVRLPATQF